MLDHYASKLCDHQDAAVLFARPVVFRDERDVGLGTGIAESGPLSGEAEFPWQWSGHRAPSAHIARLTYLLD